MRSAMPDSTVSEWAIRVPASSANLGAGFDVLGLAVSLHAEVGCGVGPPGAHDADEHHPAMVAFRRLGGVGRLWVRSSIPMGRGLGFSGSVRVGGASAAVVQRDRDADLRDSTVANEILKTASALEGHSDNAAASLMGGVVVAAGDDVIRVPLNFDPAVLVWIPNSDTTSTDRSRAQLGSSVNRDDAVFNIGRAAMFVAACASGDSLAIRAATEDRLHQVARLEHAPDSASALAMGLELGAWGTWLSGSGPAVAMFCDRDRTDGITAALPSSGHCKVVEIDRVGAIVTTAL
jgi:homoserine kinase